MKHMRRYNKSENVPQLGMIQRYDTDSVEKLVEKLDFSHIPWEVKAWAGWARMGPDRNTLRVRVRVRVRDVENRRKWTWIGPAYRPYIPWPRGKKYIPESTILIAIQNILIDIVEHELDENVSWFGRRIFDTHTRAGRKLTGRR